MQMVVMHVEMHLVLFRHSSQKVWVQWLSWTLFTELTQELLETRPNLLLQTCVDGVRELIFLIAEPVVGLGQVCIVVIWREVVIATATRRRPVVARRATSPAALAARHSHPSWQARSIQPGGCPA